MRGNSRRPRQSVHTTRMLVRSCAKSWPAVTPRRLAPVVVATLGLALVPAAIAVATQSTGLPPAAGVWKLHSINNGAPEVASGAFTVTSRLFVTGLHLVVGPGAETACGAANVSVKVLGSQLLRHDPPSTLGSPTNEYAISSPTSVIEPVSVKVTGNGRKQAGQLEIAFGPGTRGGAHTGGDVYYDHGNCDLSFGVAKA